jgi:hypothetical protein
MNSIRPPKKYSGKTMEEVDYYFDYEFLKGEDFAHEGKKRNSNLKSDIEHFEKNKRGNY